MRQAGGRGKARRSTATVGGRRSRLGRGAATLLLAVAMLALACGGGEESLESYFGKLETAYAGALADLEVLGSDYAVAQTAAATDAEYVDATRAFLTAFIDRSDELVEALRKLKPPQEAANAQDELLAALINGTATFAELRAGYKDRSRSEAEELGRALSGDLANISASEIAACRELQEIADASAIAVDLKCAR